MTITMNNKELGNKYLSFVAEYEIELKTKFESIMAIDEGNLEIADHNGELENIARQIRTKFNIPE